MFVPLTIKDHLERADLVYGTRIGIIDEPDQPAQPMMAMTYSSFAAKAKAMAKGFEELGVAQQGRVAMVSHNASRMLTFLFGTAAWGRIGVPINFRLNHEEISYIIEHSGAEVLIVDPELED
ncbi:MAG: AMP-binding protein, partial [Actinomycetota bacterium]|nr:AMP-binding protein [Actinomycetota bacterium]